LPFDQKKIFFLLLLLSLVRRLLNPSRTFHPGGLYAMGMFEAALRAIGASVSLCEEQAEPAIQVARCVEALS